MQATDLRPRDAQLFQKISGTPKRSFQTKSTGRITRTKECGRRTGKQGPPRSTRGRGIWSCCSESKRRSFLHSKILFWCRPATRLGWSTPGKSKAAILPKRMASNPRSRREWWANWTMPPIQQRDQRASVLCGWKVYRDGKRVIHFQIWSLGKNNAW